MVLSHLADREANRDRLRDLKQFDSQRVREYIYALDSLYRTGNGDVLADATTIDLIKVRDSAKLNIFLRGLANKFNGYMWPFLTETSTYLDECKVALQVEQMLFRQEVLDPTPIRPINVVAPQSRQLVANKCTVSLDQFKAEKGRRLCD